MRSVFFRNALLSIIAVCGSPWAQAKETVTVQVLDQKVAEVNGEAISKREVEERMEGMADRLEMFKRQKQRDGTWDAKTESEWNGLYIPSFRDSLRKTIREKLMLQYFKNEKMTIEDKEYKKRVTTTMDQLRRDNNRNFTTADVELRIRNLMMLEEFQGKFYNALEFPKKPEVEKYYRDNLQTYQRKAGYKVRLIRIDRTVVDKYTGVSKVREDNFKMLQDVRENIVKFGASFAEEARNNSDDESKERGGLLTGTNNDPYIIPEEANKTIAGVLASMKVGDVSEIFNYGNGVAILQIEDRREAGPSPLEGKLYDEIYRKLLNTKTRKNEDEWFRATLAKSLIINSTENRPLDVYFFFPDDKKNKPDFDAKTQGNAATADKKPEK